MHPEIRQVGPGSCPICGMALEPAEASLEERPNQELLDMTRRLWIGGALAVPVLAVDMGGHLFAIDALLPHGLKNWLLLVLATPVVLWAGWPFFVRGAQSVARRSLNMFTLIALGTGVAWLYSVVATVAPGLFPRALHGADGLMPVYFEPAAIIVVLVLVGQVLELSARDATGGAIKALLGLAPRTAMRVGADGKDSEVAIDQIAVSDRAARAAGREGAGRRHGDRRLGPRSTNRPSPASPCRSPRRPAPRVIGGTVNTAGAFVMKAELVGADTMLARIVKMVSEAQRSRAPIQRLADRVAGWFVPVVIAVAVLAFIAWMIWGPTPAFAYALLAAVSVLIIACPCALGLATPMSIMVGVGRGAAEGILIRNAEALERLEKVDTLLFDKTGTLTVGKPAVTAIESLVGLRRGGDPATGGQPRARQPASHRHGDPGGRRAARARAGAGRRLRCALRQGRDRHRRGQAPGAGHGGLPDGTRSRCGRGRRQGRRAARSRAPPWCCWLLPAVPREF